MTTADKPGIALVAHDGKKRDLCEWAAEHAEILSSYRIYATGTTGGLLVSRVGLDVECLRSGPLGGDQQIGSRMVEGAIRALVFFCDPLGLHPHSADVNALQRLAMYENVPMACNRATADHLIRSLALEPAVAGT